MDDVELFRGAGWNRSVRIPALAAVSQTRVVVMAVRRYLISDWGPSDLLVRRSDDAGASWSRARVLVRAWGRTVDNPTLVVADDGTVHLMYQTGYRRLWHRVSTDGGTSFGRSRELTGVVRSASVPGFHILRLAPGPGAGTVLTSGRLVVPVWASAGRRNRPSATLTIVSDDNGRTWTSGDVVAGPLGPFPNPSEAAVAATADGGAVLTFRQRTVPSRVFSWSPDGATGWTTPVPIQTLFEPGSHAALANVTVRGRFLVSFANPDSRASTTPALPDGRSPRENLTLRWSGDGGHTWSDGTVVDPGPSGYVALAASPDGRLHAVWEHGRRRRAPTWPAAIRYREVTESVHLDTPI